MLASAAVTANASALSNGKRGFHLICFMVFSLVTLLIQYLSDPKKTKGEKSVYSIPYLNYVDVMIAAEDDDLGPAGKRLRPGISAEIITELTDCNAALSQQRKRRQVPLILI